MTEKRTLAIQATLNDSASSGFLKMQRTALDAANAIGVGFSRARGFVADVAKQFTALAAEHAFEKVFELGIEAVREFAAEVVHSVEVLTNLGRVSDSLGLTAESLTAVRHQAEEVGVSVEQLGGAFKDFEVNVAKAAEGSKEQTVALARLGLTTQQFSGDQLDAVDVLATVADAMSGVSSQSERTRLAVQLFGRSGEQLAPLLKRGGAAIREMADEARAAGAVFSREELAKVEELNASWIRLRQGLEALAERILVDVAPAFTELFNEIGREVRQHAPEVRNAILDLADIFVKLAEVLATVAVDVAQSLSNLTSYFNDFALRWKVIGAELNLANFKLFGDQADIERAQIALANVRAELANLKVTMADTGLAQEYTIQGMQDGFERLRETIRKARQEAGQPITQGKPVDAAPPAKLEETDKALQNIGNGIQSASMKWRDFNKAAFEAGQQLVDGPLNAFDNALGSIIDGTKSAKQAFKDFGRETIHILAQVIAKLITVRIMSAIFGGANVDGAGAPVVARAKGGVDPGSVLEVMPLRRFAKGGVARGPMLALMGEGSAPAEAFVPLPDGKRIPVEWSGGGGGSGGTTNVYIHAVDAKSVQRLLSEHRGLLRAWSHEDLDERVTVRQQLTRAS